MKTEEKEEEEESGRLTSKPRKETANSIKYPENTALNTKTQRQARWKGDIERDI